MVGPLACRYAMTWAARSFLSQPVQIATRFRLELSKGGNDGIPMEAVETNDPVVICSPVNKD